MMKKFGRFFAMAVVSIMVGAVWVKAGPAPENSLVNQYTGIGTLMHADATISATASPTAILTPNPIRLWAECKNTGGTNSARVGNVSTIGTNSGNLLAVNSGNASRLYGTGNIFAYSTAGTTVACDEVVPSPAVTPFISH